MVARGEAIGVLHLVQTGHGRLTESLELLAATAAEHFALSFANLKLHETLRIQSIRDPLTGLFNRRFMEESLARELQRAERHERSVAVMMLDLDRFKVVNDTLGHQAGDAVLREVGSLLAANSRGGDIACRYGGDEFILILPESSSSDTLRRAEHLLESVRLLQLGREPGGRITASIGVASFAEHGTTAGALLRAADKALYRAKAEGRDRVALAD
jgi:diguanylate cyclase (GGDEF)-like protein